MSKNIEIEIKVTVERTEPLLNLLTAQGVFKKEIRQIDEYFTPADAAKDFLRVRPIKQWLRLRDAGGIYSINYKNWYEHHADEFETSIEDIDQSRNILLALDFRPVVIVDKLRRTWEYQDYEIALDTVKDLGDFVEIEYIGNDSKPDPKAITDQMLAFLIQLDCGAINKDLGGYPFLLLFPEEARTEGAT